MPAEASRVLASRLAAGGRTVELVPPFAAVPAVPGQEGAVDAVLAPEGLPAGAAASWVAEARRVAPVLLVAAPRVEQAEAGPAVAHRPAGWDEVAAALREAWGEDVSVVVAAPRRAWTLAAEGGGMEGAVVEDGGSAPDPAQEVVVAVAGAPAQGLPLVLLGAADEGDRLAEAVHAAERRADTWETAAVLATREKEWWERHAIDVRDWKAMLARAEEAERQQRAWEERATGAERQVEILLARIRAASGTVPVRGFRRLGAAWARQLTDRL